MLDARANHIVCDTRGCQSTTPFPIQMDGSPTQIQASSSASGWVFVAGGYEPRHFCPRCAKKMVTTNPQPAFN